MISIVTSLYKSEKYLPEFIKHLEVLISWVKENNFPFEYIVIANDPSAEELEAFEKFKSQPWFYFVSITREPLYATWNRGVDLAKGKIVGFWNVDDIRYPEALAECRDLVKRGAELVYFPFKISRYLKIFNRYFLVHKQTIKDKIPEFNERSKNDFLYQMNCGPFFMFTKELYKKVGPFDEQFKISGDFDWCARAVKLSNNFVKAKNLAGEFRVDGGGLSAGGSMRQVVENNVIYRRNYIQDKILPEDRELAKQYRADAILFQGNYRLI